jgi:ribosomal protein S18 acetylase RimI-like enzyme
MPSESFASLLASAEVEATAALLAEALDDDPAYRFLFPEGAKRRRGLAELFAGNLRTHLPYRCTYVFASGGVVSATVTVRPPGGVPISALTMVRRGLVPFAVTNGLSAVRRLFTLKGAYDRLEAELSPGGAHWHVHMMAVARSEQGRGLGSRLLDQVLAATADGDGRPACPTVLTTHQERNVTFYLRAGFAVVDDRRLALAPRAGPYRVWGMRRPASRSA